MATMRKRTRVQRESIGDMEPQRSLSCRKRLPESSQQSPVEEIGAATPVSTDTDLQSLLTEARAEIDVLRSQIVSTRSSNSIQGSTENKNTSCTTFRDDRLIPEFDPSDSTQGIDDWLRRVNDCAAMYLWDEVTKMYLALGKLRGTARIWYNGLKTTQFTWSQWENMLKDMFPNKITFGKLFYEAATYQVRSGQDLNEYCFLKLAKLNKLNLNLTQEQIVDCILEGIRDPQMKITIRAGRCSTFVELSEYVSNFPSTIRTFTNAQISDRKTPVVPNFRRQKDIVCFLCNQPGHKRTQCNKYKTIRCTFCNKIGHETDKCRFQQKDREGKRYVNYVGKNLENKYHKKARINKKIVNCIVDMGSELTLIKYSQALKLKLKIEKLDRFIYLSGFNGSQVIAKYKSIEIIQIDEVCVLTEILVLEDCDLRFELLIGQNFTDHPSVLIINSSNSLVITQLPDDSKIPPNMNNKYAVNTVKVEETTNKGDVRDYVCGPITAAEQDRLTQLLINFQDRFCFETSQLGKTSTTSMTIECTTEKPIVYRPYRLSISEREKVDKIIKDLLTNGIIRSSRSPYASPILLVAKQDGGQRLCIDYRALNKITKKDKFPLPLIQDQIDRLGGHKYFITLDLSQGFYQIPLSESSVPKTAFVTPDGHFEFLRMPAGLANAPSEFQRLMNLVLGDYINNIAQVYIDDIIIPAKNVDEGFERLHKILARLRCHNLTLKLSKCKFFLTKIDYLGREISADGVRPGSRKISAVQRMPLPTNLKQLRQFLGLAGYFRSFIKNFASRAEPLTRLLKKDVSWKFGSEQLQSFNKIKELLTMRPILRIFNPNLKTEVHTDASKVGVAGILFQIDDGTSKRHAVAYFSRQTSVAEQNYHSYQLETLAVVESFRHFRVYLIGIQFTLVTDCIAIRSTAEKKDLIPRVARWWLELQDFQFNIQYRSGLRMNHVDCLSRNPPRAVLSVTNITEVEWLLAAQLQDETISMIREILLKKDDRSETRQYFSLYKLKGDIVYRKVEDGSLKWLVPNFNRFQICKLCHDDIGHFGVDKTLSKIRENYYFPKMRKFVTKYVNSCLNCLYYKAPSGKKPGQLHPIEKVAVPFHTLHLDHVGPFVRSRRHYSQILVIVDGFTKFSILEAVKNTKTRYVVKTLTQLIDIFGVPARIITDRGTSFTSHAFKTFCQEYGIKHIMNAVATPRANGQCERYNRTILGSLAALNGGMEDDAWDSHVKTVQRGLNSTINQSIKMTPSELLFGTRIRSVPEGIILGELQNDVNRLELSEVREKVKAQLDEAQVKQKERFDKKRGKALKYAVGTLVLLRITSIPSTGESKKLYPKFRGPFRVVAVLPNERYEVEDLRGKRRKQRTVVAVDHIKPWITLADK